MASGRIRSLKPEWLEDERLASVSDTSRMVSVALILLADDHGNGRAHPLYLASRVWPYSSRAPSEVLATLSRALNELADIGFVQLYAVNGQQCFSVRNWRKHQRVDKPSRPHVPGPDKADPEPTGGAEGGGSVPPTEPGANGSRGSREGLDEDLGSGREGRGGDLTRADARPGAHLPAGPHPTETDAQAVAVDWNREAHRAGAIGSPYRRWSDDFSTVAIALHRLGEERSIARVALCAWWWRAADGPIASGRVNLHRANPGHLTKHLGADIEAARLWWSGLEESAQDAILATPSQPSAEATA